MKIVGKYDYWDSVGAAYGRDESVILVKDLDVPESIIATRDVDVPYSSRRSSGMKLEIADALYYPFIGVGDLWGVVIVAGEVYPFFASVDKDKLSRIDPGNWQDASRVDLKYTTAWSAKETRRLYPKINNVYSFNNNTKRDLDRYFNNPEEYLYFDPKEFLIDNKAAFAIIAFSDKGSRGSKKLDSDMSKLNPSFLGKMGFQSIIEPFQMYQKVMQFQSGVLTNNPVIAEVSNNSKIQKAGFDTKTSFRKPKQT